MKQPRKVKSKKAAAATDSKARTAEQIQLVQTRVANVILDNSVEMANRVVQSVMEGGQITALKFLWQSVGLFPEKGAKQDDGNPDVLAKMLLERMGLDERESPKDESGDDEDGDVESEEEAEE